MYPWDYKHLMTWIRRRRKSIKDEYYTKEKEEETNVCLTISQRALETKSSAYKRDLNKEQKHKEYYDLRKE